GEDPYALNAVIITHEHADHVSGLPVLARKLNIPVYFTEGTHRAWVRQMTPRTTMSYKQWLEKTKLEKEARLEAQALAHQIAATAVEDRPDDHFFASDVDVDAVDATTDPEGALRAAAAEDLCEDLPAETKVGLTDNPSYLPAVEYFQAGKQLCIGDIDVLPFTIPHDAADPCGFVFQSEGLRIGFATDLGYVPPNVKLALKNCDILLLESNHDLEMLRDGPYPWSVKQRVLSRVGHLSNAAAAEFLTRDYDGGARYVVLAHLSESNNMPELARLAAEQALGNHPSLLGNRVLLADQSAPMEPICL
ncbi:MAG TPA: MBL fold metallo-hydrolase, partial [Terriglobus sp.]